MKQINHQKKNDNMLVKAMKMNQEDVTIVIRRDVAEMFEKLHKDVL